MGLISENIIPHVYQPDGYSCGPTCLKMILESNHINKITIEDIKNIVGTNNIKGTTLEEMIVGLKHLNIDYEYPKLPNEEVAINYLNESLKQGNPIILRTLTMGVKHWVIVDGFDGKTYTIKDPWLGNVEYNKVELINIWKPRNFDCLKILKTKSNGLTIRMYNENDREQVNNLLKKTFSYLMSEEKLIKYIDAVTNYSKSIVVELNDEIIGTYLFGDRQIESAIKTNKCDKIYIKLEDYKNKIGLEGVALSISDKHRKLGIGSKLKDYVKNLGVDYVWGLQFKNLNNLDMWLKRRKLAAENNDLYVTIQDFI
jgi:predicted double-glycine peptidase